MSIVTLPVGPPLEETAHVPVQALCEGKYLKVLLPLALFPGAHDVVALNVAAGFPLQSMDV